MRFTERNTLWGLLLIAALGAAALASCKDINLGTDDFQAASGTNDDASADDDSVTDMPESCSSDTPWMWDSCAQSFFQVFCVRCHSDPPQNGAPMPLATKDEVAEWSDHVKEHVVDREMPPDGKMPTDVQVQNLVDWIDSGLP